MRALMRYLVATVVLSLTGLAALPPLPVSDGIPVRLDAYRLPNGMSTVPVQFLLHRAPDQYLPGVVLVKTRRAFGPIVQEQGFRSTALQKALASVQVRAVRAVFPEYASQLLQSADPLGIGRIYEVRYAAPVDPYDVCALLLGNPDRGVRRAGLPALPAVYAQRSEIPEPAVPAVDCGASSLGYHPWSGYGHHRHH